MEMNRASNQVSGIIQVMNLMKGDRDAKSMPKQLEKSDKSRIDPNDQEDAKSILDFQILPRQVPLPHLPLHVPFLLAVPSANIYGMSEHSRVTMNRRTAPCRVRTRNSSSFSKMKMRSYSAHGKYVCGPHLLMFMQHRRSASPVP